MKTKNLVLCGVFAAIMAVLSPISIPVGPVPITFGVLAVFLCAGMLPPKLSVITQLVYLALGAIGLPIFSGFSGGIAKFAGPTGGYLVVYPIMALVISLLLDCYDKVIRRGEGLHLVWTVGSLLIGTVICYVGGSLWYSYSAHVPFQQALAVTAYPFLPMEGIKIILAVFLIMAVRKRIRAMAE